MSFFRLLFATNGRVLANNAISSKRFHSNGDHVGTVVVLRFAKRDLFITGKEMWGIYARNVKMFFMLYVLFMLYIYYVLCFILTLFRQFPHLFITFSYKS